MSHHRLRGPVSMFAMTVMNLPSRPRRAGFTLVEILVATAISLIMLGAVVAVFASVMQSINQARAVLETSDRLRSAGELLRSDLKGLTVIPIPPRDPASNEGYFEYTEGPIGRTVQLVGINSDDRDANANPLQDFTAGDTDDILMFTTRSAGEPFRGRCLVNGTPTTIESDVAEVAWFVRGNRLFRQIRLVAPKAMELCDANRNGILDPGEFTPSGDSGANNFRRYYDIAMHYDVTRGGWVFSTLGDLTKPENRYAHRNGDPRAVAAFPFHPHRVQGWNLLGLPTLAESASAGMVTSWLANGVLPPVAVSPRTGNTVSFDLWADPFPFQELDPQTGLLTSVGQLYRESEDLVLTNVLAFDVKIWDPEAPIGLVGTGPTAVAVRPGDAGFSLGNPLAKGSYVDLAYSGNSAFAGPPAAKTRLGNFGLAVYDTWSNHYEKDGLDQDGMNGPDTGTDGFDNNGNGLVDEFEEWEAPPPYPAPCRGIQVTIRVFEPDSRQIRQLTITQDFLPR